MSEKRDCRRYRKRVQVRFGTDTPSKLAFTEEISALGMFIKTALIYPPGSRVTIEITLPDNSLVRFNGSIRWAKKVPPNMLHLARKCGFGVKILNFSSGEENYRKFLDELPA